MKKLSLLLCALSIIFSSCSSDDDSGSQDPIVGTWTFHQFFEDGVQQSITACEMQETFTFSSNGTTFYEFYEDTQGACELEESINGTWSSEGNVYTLTVAGESSSEEITFEGNTFYFEYTEFPDPTDPVPVTYREVYIRN